MHLQQAGASGERRRDRGVVQLDLRVFDRGAIRADRRLERRGVGHDLVDLLARRDAALGQVLVSRGLGLGVRGLCLIARQRRLGLMQCRFERASIEPDQHLVLFDVVAFLEVDRTSARR